MYYTVCPRCGSHLDPSEKCDCIKKEATPTQPEQPQPKGITTVSLSAVPPDVKLPRRTLYG